MSQTSFDVLFCSKCSLGYDALTLQLTLFQSKSLSLIMLLLLLKYIVFQNLFSHINWVNILSHFFF